MGELERKIDLLEKDIGELKVMVMQQSVEKSKNKVSLKGSLKGLKISDTEIKEAKKSALKHGA